MIWLNVRRRTTKVVAILIVIVACALYALYVAYENARIASLVRRIENCDFTRSVLANPVKAEEEELIQKGDRVIARLERAIQEDRMSSQSQAHLLRIYVRIRGRAGLGFALSHGSWLTTAKSAVSDYVLPNDEPMLLSLLSVGTPEQQEMVLDALARVGGVKTRDTLLDLIETKSVFRMNRIVMDHCILVLTYRCEIDRSERCDAAMQMLSQTDDMIIKKMVDRYTAATMTSSREAP